MTWWWLAVLPLAAVAGFALWRAFTSPSFVAGLIAYVTSATFKLLKPNLKKYWAKHTPEEWEAIRKTAEQARRGDK